ncbi:MULTISPECIES: C4-type zinc ribbon domain-containing protein [Arthrobacter]|uniref:C4-type zinc ribbon domain-containing protein n=2 Tax=Arthrobacter TaxID=1663 RepID=A0ABU9KFH1_9MICC|nr:C4-type zinc ribbon domain-containing protein [Arthrobacter sp. YJM1]MDP5225622.1 C4-type zinc ribbon domain-containing protein [Arthrobacter sp. YJM1]
MAKSPVAEQFKLLELQAFDSRLKALATRLKQLEQDPRLPPLTAGVTEARVAVTEAAFARDEVRKSLTGLEDEVAGLDARIERDNVRLNAGGLSKDLVALQKDIEGLERLKGSKEDTELELMEQLEEAETLLTERQETLAGAESALAEVQAELGALAAEAAQERAGVAGERDGFAATIEPGLVALYQKTLERRGVGAARLFHGHSEGSGMDLSPGDLAEVRAAAEDDVVYCPDSGVILVRSPEWN